MSKLAEKWTEARYTADTMASTIAAVRRMVLFSLVSRNRTKYLKDLNSPLDAGALKGNRAALICYLNVSTTMSSGKVEALFLSTPENSSEAFLIDESLKRGEHV